MKKLILILVALMMVVASNSYAGRYEKCNWIWSTAVTGANDAPDSVYCRTQNSSYKSEGASYKQSTQEAHSISVTWNTNSPTLNAQVVCANVSTDSDLNFLISNDGGVTFDTGTGTAAYYQEDDLGNEGKSWSLEDVKENIEIVKNEQIEKDAKIVEGTIEDMPASKKKIIVGFISDIIRNQ